MKLFKNSTKFLIALFTLSFLAGCVTTPQLATPAELAKLNVQPIEDNSGKYMSPITSDNLPAEWVDNSINAKIGAGVGAAAGAVVGAKLLENIPLVGGFLGSKVGDYAGRKIAISAAGGEEFIKESSDLSFNNLENMSVYLYASYGENPNYAQVVDAASEIYPELKQVNYSALMKATNRYQQDMTYHTNEAVVK